MEWLYGGNNAKRIPLSPPPRQNSILENYDRHFQETGLDSTRFEPVDVEQRPNPTDNPFATPNSGRI